MTTDSSRQAEDLLSTGRYKYQRLRERLRAAIGTGELQGKLPGERELARRYHANAKTINKALCDLTLEGLLIRHVGRGTFVVDDLIDKDAGSAVRTFGWLRPPGSDHPFRKALFSQAAEMLRNSGHVLEDGTASGGSSATCICQSGLPPWRLRGWSGLIILSCRPCTDLLADLHRRHVPVVLANNCHDRIHASVVLPDYAQGAFELCQQLIQLGHEHILLLVSLELLPAAAVAESGYRAAMLRYGLSPRETVVCSPGFDARPLLGGSDPPAALICVGSRLALSCRSALTTPPQVPGGLSIAVLPEPGDPIPAEQGFTAYEVPPDAILRWAVDLLLRASPGRPAQTVIVPGRLKDRASLSPPAAGTLGAGMPTEAVF